jgi:hypothetical protein
MDGKEMTDEIKVKKEFIFYENNLATFLVNATLYDAAVEADIYEVISWDYQYNPSDKELYGELFLKWDGCSTLNFSSLHLCGKEDWKLHIALMEWLYKTLSKEIPLFLDNQRW